MTDRVPLYPGRVTLTSVSGQTNTYDMVMADQPQVAGTPLNKATFLKDATAALLSLSGDPTVDDAINALFNHANTKAKVQFGSYVGTGTYRSAGAASITCSFAPKIIAIIGGNNASALGLNSSYSNNQYRTLVCMDEVTTTYANYHGFGYYSDPSNYYGRKSADGKTLYWYNEVQALQMFNESGRTYYWMAIG